MVAPDSAIEVGAVVVNVPPHTADDPLATVSPVGNVSVNATPFNALAPLGLVIVKVSEVVAFSAIADGLNALAITGGSVVTVTLAFAVLPVPPPVDVTVTLLFFVPSLEPVTLTVSVHESPGVAMLPPDSVTEPVPDVAVAVPPQPFVNPLGVAIVKPAGNVSVKAMPVIPVGLAGGLMIVNVKGVAVFGGVVGVDLHLPALPALKSALTSESESARR
jgi:hypothetical protein